MKKYKFLQVSLVTWVYFFLIVLVTLGVTVILVLNSIAQNKSLAEERFAHEVDSFVFTTQQHFSGSSTTLWSLKGFFAGSEEVTRSEFNKFVETSRFFDTYQGFSTLAYIPRVLHSEKSDYIESVINDTSMSIGGYPNFQITPEGRRDEYWPIQYVYPEDKFGSLLGVDQFAETARSNNLIEARDTGDLVISPILTLEPENKPGVIIALPIYAGNEEPNSVVTRKLQYVGAITSALYLDEFFTAISSEAVRNLDSLEIYFESPMGGNRAMLRSSQNLDNSIFQSIYGSIEQRVQINLASRGFDLLMTVNSLELLNDNEVQEPFRIVLINVLLALLFCVVILLIQKYKNSNAISRRYKFISTLSHQLRTPITVLEWELETLEERLSNASDLGAIKAATRDIASITEHLLLYLSISHGYQKSASAQLGIGELYDLMMNHVSDHHNKRRIFYTEDPALEDYYILADKNKLSLAVSFLVDNALTYSKNTSSIHVESKHVGKHVEFIIHDNGYSIPDLEQQQVFAEFFRATNASLGKNAGSGVSLYIARSIIELYKGTISFLSNIDEGTTFIVKLPIIKRVK